MLLGVLMPVKRSNSARSSGSLKYSSPAGFWNTFPVNQHPAALPIELHAPQDSCMHHKTIASVQCARDQFTSARVTEVAIAERSGIGVSPIFLSFKIRSKTLRDSPGAREMSSRTHKSEVSTPPGRLCCRMISPPVSGSVERITTASPISSASLVSRCICSRSSVSESDAAAKPDKRRTAKRWLQPWFLQALSLPHRGVPRYKLRTSRYKLR